MSAQSESYCDHGDWTPATEQYALSFKDTQNGPSCLLIHSEYLSSVADVPKHDRNNRPSVSSVADAPTQDRSNRPSEVFGGWCSDTRSRQQTIRMKAGGQCEALDSLTHRRYKLLQGCLFLLIHSRYLSSVADAPKHDRNNRPSGLGSVANA